jgi:hypothetical protein
MQTFSTKNEHRTSEELFDIADGIYLEYTSIVYSRYECDEKNNKFGFSVADKITSNTLDRLEKAIILAHVVQQQQQHQKEAKITWQQ